MSKEHAYAYEAGYRDGSIHYELEHCPACKNVADLQEALAENAKLRELLAYAAQAVDCYTNGKECLLRSECVVDGRYIGCVFERVVRELGIEVDE